MGPRVRRRCAAALVAVLGGLLVAVPAGADAGDLDPAFGDGGKVRTAFASFATGSDVAVASRGRIVVVGRMGGGPKAVFALARYDRRGHLDASFGGDGMVTTGFGRGGAQAAGVAIQADGRIVVAGDSDGRFALARYLPDGTLDTSFSGDGRVRTRFGRGEARATAVALGADGSIVAAGSRASPSCCPPTIRFALARYGADGSLDATFGDGGKVTTAFEGYGQAFADGVAIQPDGGIVAAGTAACEVSCSRFALARYLPDGSLDASFGVAGTVVTDLTGGFDMANAVAIAPDGSIVAAGEAGYCCEWTGSFGLVRYGPDGTPDASFGGDGVVITNFTRTDDVASDVAVAPDGTIVAAGTAGYDVERSRFALARYGPDGTRDTSFGGDGRVTTRFGPGLAGAGGLAITPRGAIVAAGGAIANEDAVFAVARYLG